MTSPKRPETYGLFTMIIFVLMLSIFVSCDTPPNTGSATENGVSDQPNPNRADDPLGDPTTPATVHVRKNIASLTNAELDSLRAGVATMKARPANDPTSWAYQGNIHGTDEAPSTAWASCQHGSYYSLSWHRMYLYCFERILRTAAQDTDLALPYWNYSNPGQGSLPEPFRNPATGDNPLFVSERRAEINAGFQLPPEVVRFDQAFGFTNFDSPEGSALSFGGQRVPGKRHFGSPHGQIESQPTTSCTWWSEDRVG